MKIIKKLLILGLLVGGLFFDKAQAVDINIQTAKKLAKDSKTLENMLKDFPEATKSIPIPGIDQETMDRVIAIIDNKPINLAIMEKQPLANLSKAINFLDIPKLEETQNQIIKILAGKVFGKTFTYIKPANIQSKIEEWKKLIPNDLSNQYLKPLIKNMRKGLYFDYEDPIAIFPIYSKTLETPIFYRLQTIKTDLENPHFTHDLNPVLLSHNGKIIATNSGKEINVWNANKATLIKKLNIRNSEAFSFTPDNEKLMIATGQNVIEYNFSTNKQTNIHSTNEIIREAKFSKDGSKLITINALDLRQYKKKTIKLRTIRTLKLWDRKTNTEIKLNYDFKKMKMISYLAFSPNNKILATGSTKGDVALWDTNTGKLINTFKNDNNRVVRLTFSHDNKLLGAGFHNGNVKLWDIKSNKPIFMPKEYTTRVTAIAFNNDNNIFASGSSVGKVLQWDIIKKKLIDRTAFGNTIKKLIFINNALIIHTNSSNLQVLDTSNQAYLDQAMKAYLLRGKIYELQTPEKIISLSLDANKTKLATGSEDGTVIIWQIKFKTWQEALKALVDLRNKKKD